MYIPIIVVNFGPLPLIINENEPIKYTYLL